MIGTLRVLLRRAIRSLKRKLLLLLVVVIVATPASAFAEALGAAAVDQVLAAMAEVVKDRFKAAAARSVLDRLQSELCKGKEIKIVINKEVERTLYLGGCERCRGSKYKEECDSDDLFVKTCRLFEADPSLPLTDPYLLKTLSRDTIGFAIRLAAYELDDQGFRELNLEPFADFVHRVMEQMAKDRADLIGLSKAADDLVESYTGAGGIYSELLGEIARESETAALLQKIKPVKDKEIKGKKVEDWGFRYFFDIGKDFAEARNKPCDKVEAFSGEERRDCWLAQLGLRLLPVLYKLDEFYKHKPVKPVGGEHARKDLRNLLYILDEEHIYTDAMRSINLGEQSFHSFSSEVRRRFGRKISDGRMTQAAIADSLRLIASVALALGFEREEAIEWLRQFQEDLKVKKGEINSVAALRSVPSLNWLNREDLPIYTQKMRDDFKQMLATLQLLLYRWEEKGERERLRRTLELRPFLSNAVATLTEDDYWNRSAEAVVKQLALFVGQMSHIMEDFKVFLGEQERKKMDQLANSLDAFSGILTHASERNWVAVGLNITERLEELQAEVHAQRSLAFVRILLSMYQAETVEEAKGIFEAALAEEARKERIECWSLRIGLALIGQVSFWAILILFYPTSPKIQAFFFWNPWVRRIAGLGYVSFLLAWVPYLRAKLFAPFKDFLLSDAHLENFEPKEYFEQSEVQIKVSGQSQPIKEVIPAIRNHIVLEGESGLGKTMFIRYLVNRSKRLVVYLPAEKCSEGVIEAVQAKLQGPARDPAFLKTLIYSGALDICVDGLNEVTADTRARVCQFAEGYPRGNILLATQPMEWVPPPKAKVLILQPLRRDLIEHFLLMRKGSLPGDATITGAEYEEVCRSYLTEALNEGQPEETLAPARRILSNPMDLTVVAQMLARDQKPDLFRLQEQQYSIMAADYKRANRDQEFPLRSFSEKVYQMKIDDKTYLPEEECLKELQAMERHKMVIKRHYVDAQGNSTREWLFRHDKIMEFFIVQTFLGPDTERPQRHLSDVRFRGVYFLLAMSMPYDAAMALREDLIQYAANTKDHTVSDTFIELLRSRGVVRGKRGE